MSAAPTGRIQKSKTPCLDKIRGWNTEVEPSEDDLAFEKRLNGVVLCIAETIVFQMFLAFWKKEHHTPTTP